MQLLPTDIPDVKILEPKVFEDSRGFFFESYNKKKLEGLGIFADFVQDNHSHSVKGVLRGLHYQLKRPQAKLVRVVSGTAFDVAVDLRRSSPTFGKYISAFLSAENQRMLWIPEGFAHGFLALSPAVDFLYKTTDYYDSTSEYTLRWDDPQINIQWPMQGTPILSPKDSQGLFLKDIPLFDIDHR